MALQEFRSAPRTLDDRVRALLVIAAVIVGMLVLTAIFGVDQTSPTYDIVPDPAAGLPF